MVITFFSYIRLTNYHNLQMRKMDNFPDTSSMEASEGCQNNWNSVIPFSGTVFHNMRIRVTPCGRFASIYDILTNISGSRNPTTSWKSLRPKVSRNLRNKYYSDEITLDLVMQGHIKSFKFAGPGQKITPVADAYTIMEILFLIKGEKADLFRSACRGIIIRHLGGDKTLIDEIGCNREISTRDPDGSVQGFMAKSLKNSQLVTHIDATSKDKEITLATTKLCIAKQQLSTEIELFKQRQIDDDRRCKQLTMEHECMVKRANLEIERQKEDICPKATNNELHHNLIILRKVGVMMNTGCDQHKRKRKHSNLPYIVIRRQNCSTPKELKRIKDINGEVHIVMQMYYPNPVTLFQRLREHHSHNINSPNPGIVNVGNNFDVIGLENCADKDNWIRNAVKSLTRFHLDLIDEITPEDDKCLMIQNA
jgi:hypothetical protein